MVRERLARSCTGAGQTRVEERNAVKKFFGTIKKKLRPIVLVPIVLVVAIVLGIYFLFIAGDDDKDKTATVGAPQTTGTTRTTDTSKGKLKQPPKTKLEPDQPIGKPFTIDSDRDERSFAIAQAIGSIKTPATVSARVGAAPKQRIKINTSITCLLATEGARTEVRTFFVTPPVTAPLKLPIDNAVSCTVSANAQLTKSGKGRVKIFLIGQRRGAA
jgi:hypothetical protein